MNLKFFLNNFRLLPFLPFLYFQGNKVKASVPNLPEAEGDVGLSLYDGQSKLNLLCIGESTIAGVGVSTHEEGFSGTLAKELAPLLEKDIHWEVVAKSGYTAKRVSQKLVAKIKNKPDLIVIGLGGNDSFQLNSPEQWASDIRELIGSLKGVNGQAPIFFSNMPPIRLFPAFTPLIKRVIGGRSERLGAELALVVKEFPNVYFAYEKIELKEWAERYNIEIEGNTFFSDGVHPSKLTYQTWAKEMAKYISEKWIIH